MSEIQYNTSSISRMSSEQLEKAIDDLTGSTACKTLVQFLNKKVDELDSVSGIETIEELFGRKNAIKKLKEIINRLSDQKQEIDINEYK